MSEKDDITNDVGMMNEGYQNGKLQAMNMGRAGAILLPLLGSNSNIHVTSPVHQLLQMNGLSGGLGHEDPDEHL